MSAMDQILSTVTQTRASEMERNLRVAASIHDVMTQAKAVDITCGRSKEEHTAEQYLEAKKWVEGNTVMKHMYEQCMRHKRGQSTEPYRLPRGASVEHAKYYEQQGWIVSESRSYFAYLMSWQPQYSLHRPPYV